MKPSRTVDSIILIFDTISRISKIEAGAGKEKFSTIDLGEVVSEIAENYGPVIEDNGFAVDLKISSPNKILGDAKMLGQAMANLIQNAIRYGETGSTINLFADENAIGVVNEGRGIPESERELVTRPMVRLDQARQAEGSGLGLAMVRAIAQLHSADICFEHKYAIEPHGLIASIVFES